MATRPHLRYAYLLAAQRRRRRARRPGGSRGIFVTLAAFTVVVFATVIIGTGAAYYGQVTSSEAAAAEVIANRSGGAKVYDRNGVLLYEFLNEDYGFQQRVPLDRISPLIRDATMATEDASFYSNPGVNLEGLTRAAWENLRPGDDFLEGTGGSSITQQLVKEIYFTREQRAKRSIERKVKEAFLAVELTREYEKDQILEWYLNEISYGGVYRGIQSAARGYFGVDANAVTLAQAAFLAGLPQSPSEYDPFANLPGAIDRQRQVLDLMVRHGFIGAEEAAWAKYEEIRVVPEQRPFHAQHFVQYVGDYVKATLGEHALYNGGLEIHTTLDLALQWKANAALEKYLTTYENSSQGHNGSVVVLHPPTGEILVMVGSRDYTREDIDGSVNNAVALNSPGSTLKPFTYATAFKQGWGPEWPIVDSAITYKEVDGKTFSPRNPDGRTRGVMPAREALGNSFNIPAFKTILWAGVDNTIATAKAMGISTLDRDLGPALTLGGVDVKLLDLVYGYSTFANNGVTAGTQTTQWLPSGNRTLDPNPVLRVTNQAGETLLDNTLPEFHTAIGAEYAYMITEILSDDRNRQITYGRGSTLNIPGHRVAVKTGTSEPYDDNTRRRLIGDTWTVGYTPDIAVGVWVGNTDNTPMVNISSTTIAGGTWHDVIVAALEGKPARDWVRPEGLIQERVCVPSGRVVTPGVNCRSVTGTFAAEALAKQDEGTWGGADIEGTISTRDAVASIPAGISEWKRYLAQEYLRSFGGRAPSRSAPAPAPTTAPAPPAAPPAENEGGGEGNNGNGNGNGNRRR
jgi:membrane peptidoglycan carboxypeptidase